MPVLPLPLIFTNGPGSRWSIYFWVKLSKNQLVVLHLSTNVSDFKISV